MVYWGDRFKRFIDAFQGVASFPNGHLFENFEFDASKKQSERSPLHAGIFQLSLLAKNEKVSFNKCNSANTMNITLTDRAIQIARQMQKLGFPVTAMGGDTQSFDVKFDLPINQDFSLWLQVQDTEELTITLIHIPTNDWVLRTSFLPRHLKLVLDCFVVPASRIYSTAKVA